MRVGVVASDFHEAVTGGLLRGCLGALRAAGVADDDMVVAHVPGALELSVVAGRLARRGGFDALVVLGCVIQGDTDHYDFVCAQATRGCGAVAHEHGLPLGFGLLTCRTAAQALARAGDDEQNKGAEAARAALVTARVLEGVDALDADLRPRTGFRPKTGDES
ncbi:MAG: 6,7-dimethyl-8-ribityllumazine synthase [Planctomycetes bacterium]|nr:6,7-dimethyl-8-ribityllumazine synthase [Planctomycetota bacterium]